ncbi:MAG: hypothetical protein ABIP30_05895 [Ferruginibacter sp.]
MKWEKKGQLFDPAKYELYNDCKIFAQSPQTLVFDDFVRIYFSIRKWDDAAKKYLSFIAFADFNKNLDTVIRVSTAPVINLGGLGAFDEHGIFPINVLKYQEKIYAYTCGWSRRVSVSVETSTGLAISNDNGNSFQKIGTGPILTSSLQEPMLVGDSFVQVYDDIFHMWYIFGQRWKQAEGDEPPARVYKIAHAVSADGINWKKEEGIPIISDLLNEDECQALPTVIKIGNRYHMYFCFREATDFRTNKERGYQLGYAWSDDLVKWHRDDKNKGIEKSTDGWDNEMMCYPHIFECDGKVHLLYNGNEFGKYGFGLATLLSV